MNYLKKGRDIIYEYINIIVGIPINKIQLRAFTLWYTFMTICIYNLSIVYSSIFQLVFNTIMKYAYGLCCVLSYIEFNGFWGFAIIYYIYYKTYLVVDMYYADPEIKKYVKFNTFLILDIILHLIIPITNIYLFNDYMNVYSVLSGYILVRYWHYYYSPDNRIYSCPVDIYKFNNKNIPYWLWVVIWSIETTTILLLLKYNI